MRTFEQIAADIAACEKQLETLHEERAQAVDAWRESIIKAFDDGALRLEICEAFGISYETLGNILHRASRSYRKRLRETLLPAERVHYDKLLRHGVPARTARQIAQTAGATT